MIEGLSIMKAVHERYGAKKRNPYDEIECSSHYSRSMASYGIYLAACGYHYHGPKGVLGFDPIISPENFNCAFTTAEGWGSYSQRQTQSEQTNKLEIVYGQLRLNTFYVRPKSSVRQIRVMNKEIPAHGKPINKKYKITFDDQILRSHDTLEVIIDFNHSSIERE